VSPAVYLTPSGAEKLAAELRQLTLQERPKVVEEVAQAAAQGDRSENAEYIYGKKRLREIDRRIRFLSKRLDSAVVVSETEDRGDVVFFGARVEVVDEDGKSKAYILVGPDEADPTQSKISFQSPLGQALLKRKKGDTVTVRRPAGEIALQIVSVRYGE
jgi:transcription elongation factor GreB